MIAMSNINTGLTFLTSSSDDDTVPGLVTGVPALKGGVTMPGVLTTRCLLASSPALMARSRRAEANVGLEELAGPGLGCAGSSAKYIIFISPQKYFIVKFHPDRRHSTINIYISRSGMINELRSSGERSQLF